MRTLGMRYTPHPVPVRNEFQPSTRVLLVVALSARYLETRTSFG
jgi:hypothetical protein